MPENGRVMKPRVEDYGDISAPWRAICPSCGEPLSGPGSRLRVVALEEHAYDVADLVADADGSFRVVADPGSPEFLGTVREFASCAACTQEIDADVSWES